MINGSQALSLVMPLTSFGNVLIVLFSILLATSIIFLNASVLCSILMNKVLRRQNRFMYMLSTCCSDICTGVSYYYVGVLDARDAPDSPTRTFFIVPTFLGVSFLAVVAAQADRYHAVVSPFRYAQRVTRARTLLVICGYWMYGLFLVALNNTLTARVAKKITISSSFMGSVLLFIIMIGFNVKLFIIAKYQLGKEPPSEERDSKRASMHLILVVAASFLMTWLPLYSYVTVCDFLQSGCYTFRNEGTDPVRIFPRINAALTPILYIRGCAVIRATLLTKVWRCRCRRRSSCTPSLAFSLNHISLHTGRPHLKSKDARKLKRSVQVDRICT